MNMSSEERNQLFMQIASSVADSAVDKLASLYNKARNNCFEELAEEVGELIGDIAIEALWGTKGLSKTRHIDFDSIKKRVVEFAKEERGSLPLNKATRDAIKRGDAREGDVSHFGKMVQLRQLNRQDGATMTAF